MKIPCRKIQSLIGTASGSRRQFLHLAASAAALPFATRVAWAQAYPSRPMRIVVPFPAGGPNDVLARLLGQWLSEQLGQPVVVENRPGAGSNIGTEVVVRAAPDGYTLLLFSSSATINATLYENLSLNFSRDIAPVAGIMRSPLVMVVNPSLPARTVPEFITYAKANPDKVSMGSAGIGTAAHVSGELFKMMTGVAMTHVPYRGGAPMLTDLIGGQVQVAFDNLPTSIEAIRAGRLRALAITVATRSEIVPNLPTIAEFIPGFEASNWFGVGAPRGTPSSVIEKLNMEINAGLANPKVKARLAELGGSLLPGSPSDLGELIASETERWAKVIRAANIKPE